MKIGKIYKIINNINDSVYIGQTWGNLNKRFNVHSNNKSCRKLYNAINKYGKMNFSIIEILNCTCQEEMDLWEIYYIKKYDAIENGYNIKTGEANGLPSAESKIRMSKANKGRVFGPFSEERKLKQSKALSGKRISDKHKIKLRQAAFNRKCKVNISDADTMKIMKESGSSTKEIALLFKISISYARGILNGSRRNINRLRR